MESIIQAIAVYAIPVIFAITLHEASHGYVARMFGDPTAAMLGRVTLNPVKHIDPIGTIVVPVVLLLMSKLVGGPFFLFGWAKPVPVNFSNLRRPKRDMIWVAAAGPLSNLVMALGWAFLWRILKEFQVEERYFYYVSQAGIQVNLMLMALNLVPIPPLDGGRILVGLLPMPLARSVASIERYGFFIVLALLATGLLTTVMTPFIAIGESIVGLIFNF